MRGKEKRARRALEQSLNATADRSRTTRAEFVRRLVEESGATPLASPDPIALPLQQRDPAPRLRETPAESARRFLASPDARARMEVQRIPLQPKCPWCGDPIAVDVNGAQARCGCGLP